MIKTNNFKRTIKPIRKNYFLPDCIDIFALNHIWHIFLRMWFGITECFRCKLLFLYMLNLNHIVVNNAYFVTHITTKSYILVATFGNYFQIVIFVFFNPKFLSSNEAYTTCENSGIEKSEGLTAIRTVDDHITNHHTCPMRQIQVIGQLFLG